MASNSNRSFAFSRMEGKRVTKADARTLSGDRHARPGHSSFGPLLEDKTGEVKFEQLEQTAYVLSSMRDRRIRTSTVYCVTEAEGRTIEKEAGLYGPKGELLAVASWKPGEGIQFTRIHQ